MDESRMFLIRMHGSLMQFYKAHLGGNAKFLSPCCVTKKRIETKRDIFITSAISLTRLNTIVLTTLAAFPRKMVYTIFFVFCWHVRQRATETTVRSQSIRIGASKCLLGSGLPENFWGSRSTKTPEIWRGTGNTQMCWAEVGKLHWRRRIWKLMLIRKNNLSEESDYTRVQSRI